MEKNIAAGTVSPVPAAELLERARALVPAIATRAEATDRARDVSAETIAELRTAGLFKLFQPTRWGGWEADPVLFYDIQNLLAEACASTAWVYGVLNVQSFMIGRFDPQAQADVWGDGGGALACSSFQPVGKVTPAEGGYRLGGRWTFASGSSHADWALLGAMVPPRAPDDGPEMRLFLLPRADYAILDTWQTFGLRGTGSNDIVVEDVFVPAYRTYRPDGGLLPLSSSQPGPALYRLPWLYMFTSAVSNLGIGAARGALNAFVGIARTRVGATGKAAKEDPAVQSVIGRVRAEIDMLDAVMKRNVGRLVACAHSDDAMPFSEAILYRAELCSMMRKLAALVDELVLLLGGRGIFLSSPLTRVWLDLSAARAHAGNDPSGALALLSGDMLSPGGR